MVEINKEIVAKDDPSLLLASVPPQVIELLGNEKTLLIARSNETARKLYELARQPNPFDKVKSPALDPPSESLREALAIIDRLYDYDVFDSALPENSAQARVNGLIIQKNASERLSLIVDNHDSNLAVFDSAREATEQVNVSRPDQAAVELSGVYEKLMAIANDLFDTTSAKDCIETVFGYEMYAARADAMNVGMQLEPELHKKVKEATSRARRSKDGSQSKNLSVSEHRNLSYQASDLGYNDPVVQESHRSIADIKSDLEFGRLTVETLRDLRNKAGLLYKLLIEKARGAGVEPAYDYFEAIADGYQELQKVIRECKISGAGNSYSDDVLVTERFLNKQAQMVEIYLRQFGAKLTGSNRRLIHDLKQPYIERSVRAIANVAVKKEAVDHVVEADAKFLRECTLARDILAGGGRLDHPNAKSLAKSVHQLKFGKDKGVVLEKHESGFLLAIAFGKVEPVIEVSERLAGAGQAQDADVDYLKARHPEQYRSLYAFKPDITISRLRVLLSNYKNYNDLLAVLGASLAKKVKDDLEALWQERNTQLHSNEV